MFYIYGLLVFFLFSIRPLQFFLPMPLAATRALIHDNLRLLVPINT
jgi:hypothetical protein